MRHHPGKRLQANKLIKKALEKSASIETALSKHFYAISDVASFAAFMNFSQSNHSTIRKKKKKKTICSTAENNKTKEILKIRITQMKS